MKLNSTLFPETRGYMLVLLLSLFYKPGDSFGQFCVNNPIFGLSSSGYVYSINPLTGAVGSSLNSYSGGNSPSSSNAIGYNPLNQSFYFFKRNPGSSNQEFVRLSQGQSVPVILTDCPTTNSVVRGCASFDGAGYYCLDGKGILYYYKISTDTWTKISSKFITTQGLSLTTTISNLSSGDMAIDGFNRLWIVLSSSSKYGLYKVVGSLPTTAITSITVEEILPATTSTPSGNPFAGICFNSSGQVLLGTISDNKLFRLENDLSLRFVANFSLPDVGTDLTSCAFPMGVLGDDWKSFSAHSTSGKKALLKWEITTPELGNEFTVEYTHDNYNWIEAGKVNFNTSQAGGLITYQTIQTFTGNTVFRILHKNKAGINSYSTLKNIDFSDETPSVKTWPIPATNELFVENTNSNQLNGKLILSEFSGKRAMEVSLTTGKNSINLSHLQRGTYYAMIQWGHDLPYRQLIIKE